MTRLQHIRALISDARRERLATSDPRLRGQQRAPHPRRDYWRRYKQARRQKAA